MTLFQLSLIDPLLTVAEMFSSDADDTLLEWQPDIDNKSTGLHNQQTATPLSDGAGQWVNQGQSENLAALFFPPHLGCWVVRRVKAVSWGSAFGASTGRNHGRLAAQMDYCFVCPMTQNEGHGY